MYYNGCLLFPRHACNHTLNCGMQLRFVEREERGRRGGKREGHGVVEKVPLVSRLQDRELQEMRDEGES